MFFLHSDQNVMSELLKEESCLTDRAACVTAFALENAEQTPHAEVPHARWRRSRQECETSSAVPGL